MDTLIDLVTQYPFLQNAIFASILASIVCGIIGTLVITNRLTFLAGATSHAAYGGIGIALFFGFPLLPCTILFSLVAALVMGWLSRKTLLQQNTFPSLDASIGVLWAAGMALGIILVELSPQYSGELMGFLFGSILTVPFADILTLLGFTCLLLLTTYFLRQGFWAISLDTLYAKARGLPVTFLFLSIIGLTAIAVVLLIRIVGLILVLALLTIPSSLARLYCRSFFGTMLIASAFCLLFCLGGLWVSWHTNVSSGAVIIAFACFCYGIGYTIRTILTFIQQRHNTLS